MGFQDRHSFHFSLPDKDENSYLNPSLWGVQPFFGWTTWQSRPPTSTFWGAYYATWESHPSNPSFWGTYYATWESHPSNPEERIMRRENLIHPIRHSEERIMRRENLINPPRHCEESDRFLVRRRGNLIC